MRIGLIGLHLETAVRNPLPSTVDAFRVHRGQAVSNALAADTIRALVGGDPPELVPIWYARARPGGRLDRAAAERLLGEMRVALAATGPVDGLLLAQHGGLRIAGTSQEATSQEGTSPEGISPAAASLAGNRDVAGGDGRVDRRDGRSLDLVGDLSPTDGEARVVAACREVLGADVPIVACYDPHGDPGDHALAMLDGACAFRTAPHVDVDETRARATRLLVRIARDGARPCVLLSRGSLVLPGAMAEGPGAGSEAFDAAARMSGLPGVLDASWLPSSPWTDRPDERHGAGAGFLVVAEDRHAALRAARDANVQVQRNGDRFRFRDPLVAVDEAARHVRDVTDDGAGGARPTGPAGRGEVAASLGAPTLLLDAGDAIGAGAVGDRWDVALALFDAGVQSALVAGLVAPALVARCRAAGDGAVLLATAGPELAPELVPELVPELAPGDGKDEMSDEDAGEARRVELRVERASLGHGTFASGDDADAPPPAAGDGSLLRLGGVDVLIRSTRREIADWDELARIVGPLSRWRTVVVKATRRPAGYPVGGRAWTLASPGATDHRVGTREGRAS